MLSKILFGMASTECRQWTQDLYLYMGSGRPNRSTAIQRRLCWDEKAFLLEQRFVRGGEVIGSAVVRARFLGPGSKRIAPSEVVALVGISANSPPLPETVARWNDEQATLR